MTLVENFNSELRRELHQRGVDTGDDLKIVMRPFDGGPNTGVAVQRGERRIALGWPRTEDVQPKEIAGYFAEWLEKQPQPKST